MVTRMRILAALLALLAPAASVSGQAREEVKVTLHGVVVDAQRGDPLPNAIVVLASENRGMLADSLGRFTFTNVPLGEQTLAVKQYGYAELDMVLDVAEGQEGVRVELQPGPLALEGFTVLADHLATMNERLENRRKAWGSSARLIDQERLASSGAYSALDLLQTTGAVSFASCSAKGLANSFQQVATRVSGDACINRRGSVMSPKVFIDEVPIAGGLGFLSTFRPYELYRVEVFSGGAQIRAYTHWYMERVAGRPEALWPLEL